MKLEEIVISKIEEQNILEGIAKGERIDGRKPFEYREIKIFPNVIDEAEASTLVTLGDTKVLAGVKLEIGEPFPDTPNKGVIITNVELLPVASPIFELGPPSDYAVELSRVVDRGIREAEIVNLKELTIIPSEKVWMIYIDIYPLDNGGNIIDAASIASVVALYNTLMPKTQIEDDNVEILEEKAGPLPLEGLVASVTFAQKDKHKIVDPTYTEEKVMDTRFTISFTAEDKVCAVQKGEGGEISPKDIKEFKNVGKKKAKKLKEIISNTLSREQKEYKNLTEIFRRLRGRNG